MSSLVFYLQADANFTAPGDTPTYRVLPYYEFKCARPSDGNKGQEESHIGRVDDGIKAAHPEEWAVFDAYVNANDTKLYEEAKKTPGVPYKFDYQPKKEVAAEPVKKSTKKGLFSNEANP